MLSRLRLFSTTTKLSSLSLFFDSPKGHNHSLLSGKAWEMSSLRSKSFQDLHKLWWTCLLEQNKLLTAEMEGRRFKVYVERERLTQVKKTMKRVKMVLWERRIAFMQATEILKRELARGSTASGSTDATESNPSAIESTAPTAKSTPSETEDDDDLVWVGRVKPSQAYKSKVTRKKRGKKTTSWAVE